MTETSWFCLESVGDEFQVDTTNPGNFKHGIEQCEKKNANLARISSFEELGATLFLTAQVNEGPFFLWLGIFVPDNFDPGDTSNLLRHDL